MSELLVRKMLQLSMCPCASGWEMKSSPSEAPAGTSAVSGIVLITSEGICLIMRIYYYSWSLWLTDVQTDSGHKKPFQMQLKCLTFSKT